jgi:hypothetical protein
LTDTADLGIEVALRLAAGKFEGDDVETFAARVESIFGVKIAA